MCTPREDGAVGERGTDSVSSVKLFISWSGDQSREFAEFLKEWFGKILPQGVETFVSSRDVEKGGRGMNTIAEALETGDFGVVIVTRDSQAAPWINFEAGALSKAVATAHVAPLLLDIPKADVIGPLTQFQMTSADDQSDVRKLVDSINRATGHEVAKATIDILFSATWDDFAAKVSSAGATGQRGRKPHRTEREMITELLELVRELRRESRSLRQVAPALGLAEELEDRNARVHPNSANGGKLRRQRLMKDIQTVLREAREFGFAYLDEGVTRVTVDDPATHPSEDFIELSLVAQRNRARIVVRRRESNYTFHEDGSGVSESAHSEEVIPAPEQRAAALERELDRRRLDEWDGGLPPKRIPRQSGVSDQTAR